MNRFTEKTKKSLVRAVQQVETPVIENPIIVPVPVVYAMLPDVACRCLEAAVLGRECVEIVEARKEIVLLEPTCPIATP